MRKLRTTFVYIMLINSISCSLRNSDSRQIHNTPIHEVVTDLDNGGKIVDSYLLGKLWRKEKYNNNAVMIESVEYLKKALFIEKFDEGGLKESIVKLTEKDSICLSYSVIGKLEDYFGIVDSCRYNINLTATGEARRIYYCNLSQDQNCLEYINWGPQTELNMFKTYNGFPASKARLVPHFFYNRHGTNLICKTPHYEWDDSGRLMNYQEFENGYLSRMFDFENGIINYYDITGKMLRIDTITCDLW